MGYRPDVDEDIKTTARTRTATIILYIRLSGGGKGGRAGWRARTPPLGVETGSIACQLSYADFANTHARVLG